MRLKNIDKIEKVLLQYGNEIQALKDEAEDTKSDFSYYIAEGVIEEYKRKIRNYNFLVNQYNSLFRKYKGKISEDNELVKKYSNMIK